MINELTENQIFSFDFILNLLAFFIKNKLIHRTLFHIKKENIIYTFDNFYLKLQPFNRK